MNSRLNYARERGRLTTYDLNTVCDEPGAGIAPDVRTRLERSLQADLSAVTIHTSQAADVANQALGARAFAFGEHVVFSEGAYAPGTPDGLRLLAHELAHVVQQRRSRGMRQGESADRAEIEADADLAAEAVMAGRVHHSGVADCSGQPALWDITGHFYTPYLVFMNHGMESDAARRLALWCWLPDQVQEFDAAYVGKRNYKPWNYDWHDADKIYRKYENGAGYESERQFVTAVQSGLHVLTGGPSEPETSKRTGIFVKGDHLKLLYRGIALHPLGDCYAHRHFEDDGKDLHGDVAWLKLGHALDWTHPDEIWDPRRPGIYIRYVRDLSAIAAAYTRRPEGIVKTDELIAALSAMLRGTPTVKDGGVTRKAVVSDWSKIALRAKQLSEETVPETEEGCAAHVRWVATKLLGKQIKNDEHSDRRESIPWKEYWAIRSTELSQDSGGVTDSEVLFHRIQRQAVEWAGLNLPPPPPVSKPSQAQMDLIHYRMMRR